MQACFAMMTPDLAFVPSKPSLADLDMNAFSRRLLSILRRPSIMTTDIHEMMALALSVPSSSAQHQPRDSKRRFSWTMPPVQQADLLVKNATSFAKESVLFLRHRSAELNGPYGETQSKGNPYTPEPP